MSVTTERLDRMLAAVKRALWEEWDPIHVNEFPEARDEYDSYAPTLVASLLVRDHPEVIESKLRRILGNFGLEQDSTGLRDFAIRLLELADEVDGRKPRRAD